MILYAISNRRTFGSGDVASWAAGCLEAGVDWVQIREKDLDGGELLQIARGVRTATPSGRVLINERSDIAIATGLDGVHLPSDAPAPSTVKRLLPPNSLTGVSCHSREEVARAVEEEADFVVFGPVFDTPSKRGYGPPRGLPELAAVCRRTTIPVLALGGVTRANAVECVRAGAAGIAGISLFAEASERAPTIEELKAL